MGLEIEAYGPLSLSENRILCNLHAIQGFAIVIEWPYDIVAPFLRGRVCAYSTAEHAFQATRANTLRGAQHFQKNGLFDSYKVLEKWPMSRGTDASDTRNIRKESMLEQQGMIGVVARMAGNVDAVRAKTVWGLTWPEEPTTATSDDMARLWELILKAKFPLGSDQANFLVSTAPRYLLNYSKTATSVSQQCGRIEKGKTARVLVGKNMAGLYLMTVRKDLEEELTALLKIPCAFRAYDDDAIMLPPTESQRDEAMLAWQALVDA